jgi:hypothetical protein
MGLWDDIKGGAGKAWSGFSNNPLDPGGFMSAPPPVDPALAKWDDRDWLRGNYQDSASTVANRQAPQAGRTQLGQIQLGQASQLSPEQQAQARAMQMQHAGRLGAIASGQQQGAGELAAQRQLAQAAAQQQAMARMNRGMSSSSAQRGAARNLNQLGVTGAGQAQMAALQDQQAANAQLGSIYDQMRGQDIGLAGQNAQLAQQRMLQQGQMDQQGMLQQGQMDQAQQLQNANMQLQMLGMNDEARRAYLSQLAQMNQSEAAGRTGAAQVAMQQQDAYRGQMMQAGGVALAAMSDERAKRDIADGDRDVDEMLDALRAKTYRYKDGAPKEYTGSVGDGRTLAGIMAQHLERSKAGKAIVRDTEKGKVIDMVGGMSATLAGLARLNARLRRLEDKD